MFVPEQDFTVETAYGIPRCLPKNPNASSAFKVLQVAVQRIVPQLPDAPDVDIEIDGIIGPSITLVVQVVAQRLASGKHQGLSQLAGMQPEEAVPMVASHAMEIAGYLDDVLQKDPTALINPSTPLAESMDPMAMIKSLFTGKRIAAVAGSLLGVAALVGLGAMVQRRTLGTVDRSGHLPPSDGTDEFDEDAYDGHESPDDGHDMSDVDTENAIDAQAVEVPSHAA